MSKMVNPTILLCIYIVDVHHSMAPTTSPGKKNDHAMHNVTFEALIEYYQRKFIERDPTKPSKRVIVHADNCPSQYRCRQTILRTAAEERTGVKVSHCYAVVSNFKGVHDAVGKDVTAFVSKLELGTANSSTARGTTRSATAYKAFENCILHGLDRPVQSPHWNEFEANQDPRIEAKGTYGILTSILVCSRNRRRLPTAVSKTSRSNHPMRPHKHN